MNDNRDMNNSVAFLKAFHPQGPWTLTAIHPETRKVETMTFAADQPELAEAWINRRNGTSNLYFAVNPLRAASNKKAKATDVSALAYLHVDIDPRAGANLMDERIRIEARLTTNLPEGIPTPTVVVFSGGGYQAFWRLDYPLMLDGSEAAADNAKQWNRQLEYVFDADSCHNIDRIMRLPFTWNLPDAKKRQKGREKTLALVHTADWSRAYPLSVFEQAPMPSTPGGAGLVNPTAGEVDVEIGDKLIALASVDAIDDYTANGKPLDARTKRIIEMGHDPEDQTGKDRNDRSRWLLSAACTLFRRGVPDNVIFAAILNPAFGISAHVLEKRRNAEKYAIRQIKRAKEFAIDPALAELNDAHAVLLQEGGRARVLSWETSEIDDNIEVPVLQSFEDFQKRYMNRIVEAGAADKGKQKHVKLGRWWLEHPRRREFKALRFLPGKGEVYNGYLNLWQGFGVEPAPGCWSLMRNHVHEVLACGDQTVSDYILKWTAWSVQNPDKPAEVALVFRGGMGTGKGTFARAIKQLFGPHGLQITSSMQLTGRFNKHLRSCCLLFADEAIAPNDKSGESILKGLITEPEVIIEGKGLDAVQARNHLHIVMASNEKWVVPSGIDERRFAVFDVSESHKEDRPYFKALEAETIGGGLAAMLHDLLEYDLAGWHPRDTIPQTKALAEQKAQSLRGFERIMFDFLKAGIMPIEVQPADVQNGAQTVRTMILKAYAKREWPREHVTLNSVADVLSLLGWQQFRGNYRGFYLPSLPEARAMWSAKYFEVAWDNATTWEMVATDLEGRPEFMFQTPPSIKLVT